MRDNGNLQISVTNFGPIESAEIDLRPLTVFVGPSNTGKSYLATLVYALHRFFGDTVGAVPWMMLYGRMDESDSLAIKNVSEEQISAIADWMHHIMEQEENLKPSDRLSVPVPDSIRHLVQPVVENLSESSITLERELSRCFGVEDPRTLIRYESGDETGIRLRRLKSEYQTGLEYVSTINQEKDRMHLSVSVPSETPLYAGYTHPIAFGTLKTYLDGFRSMLDRRMGGDLRESFAFVLEFIARLIEGNALSPLNQTAHYLPADRTGVMHAHRVAVGSLIARAPYAGLQRDEPMPLLSGVLADFLRQLTELGAPQDILTALARNRKRRGHSDGARKLAGIIESEILGGAVNIHQSPTGYPSFYYRPDGWERELPLMNVSSMVSELAPVALYLRHVVSEGDTLIIEEPESHLHPALQVEFIRHIAAIVNSGVRVMLTTHSEWILNELTNLVRLSELDPDDRSGISGADYPISPDQLGIWRFEPGGEERGSVVEEIRFDEEFGGFQTGYDDVAMDNYNDYIRIGSLLGQEEAD